MMLTTRRTALVTGASRGIGAAIAERLAKDGFHVIVNYARDAPGAKAVVAAIRAAGGSAAAVQADVSDAAAVRTLFIHADQEHGGIDVLVNNAGIQKLNDIVNVPDDEFDELLTVNLRGPFNTLREAAMRMRDGGRMINLSSGTTIVLQPRYGIYIATKAALQALTTVLAKEMRGRAITVNSVSPGPVATKLYLKDKSEAQLDHAAMQSPLERLGQPADIANVVAFLAGPNGGWVNGQTLLANGAFA